MPYYLAVKVNEAKDEFLLLTTSPCTTPWNDEITTMSFADPRLITKMTITGAYTHPIYACSTPSQIMYAISIWLDFATWNEIIVLAPQLRDSSRAMNAVVPVLKRLLMQSFSDTIKPGVSFSVDQMYFAYVTRRFPLNAQSAASWKKLCVSNIGDDANNGLIRVAKQIVTNPIRSDTDNYVWAIEDTPESAKAKSDHDNSFEKYLASLSQKSMKPHMEQFLNWVDANYKNMSETTVSRVFNMCVKIITDSTNGVKPAPTYPRHKIAPEYIPLGRADASNIITNLLFLRDIGQDALYVEYICGLLTCERYVFLLQIPHVMQHLTRCMQKTPIYTSLVAYAMSFAMFYITTLEASARNDASESAPFVFMQDMVCEFPRFADPTPYVPISVRHIDSNVPFRVPGARTPVEPKDIPDRLNAAMVQCDSRFDIIKNIPWTQMNLILTGSRYASACWVGPRERDVYGGDYAKYICEYIGESVAELDSLLEYVDHNGAPLQDILGREFKVALDDQPVNVESDEKKTPAPDVSRESLKTDIDQVASLLSPPQPTIEELSKSLDNFAITAAGGVLGSIIEAKTPIVTRSKESKTPSSPSGASIAETKTHTEVMPTEQLTEQKEELPGVINENARATFMKLKYSPTLFGNHTDIDIGFVGGDTEKFDAAAAALVGHLRKYGKAVALRFQKARSYTWVIVTNFLQYTIDFFQIHQGSPLGLITNFMTSYPRAWYNGVSHICTADYVCARMSGINNRYIFTMNDPIYTMMKAARREDIAILLNYGEQGMLRKWLEVNMPGTKLVLGNVDMTNSFFEGAIAHDNERKPWIVEPIRMPKSRTILTPWTTENAEPIMKPHGILELVSGKKIRVADPTVFSRYMAEIAELSSETITRNMHLSTSR
jgi:hypothetical protein